jgi:hypothetical protein
MEQEMPAQIKWVTHRTQMFILIVVLAIMAGPVGIASAADAPQNTQLPNPQELPRLLGDFSGNRLWVIILLILLMACLFGVLFWWQNNIAQSGYFANIYGEAVENIEISRHALPIKTRWLHGEYVDELLRGGSDRSTKWRGESEHRMPTAGHKLWSLASELDTLLGDSRYYSKVRNVEAAIEQSLYRMTQQEGIGVNPFDVSSIGNLRPGASSWGTSGWGTSGSGIPSGLPGMAQQIDANK